MAGIARHFASVPSAVPGGPLGRTVPLGIFNSATPRGAAPPAAPLATLFDLFAEPAALATTWSLQARVSRSDA